MLSLFQRSMSSSLPPPPPLSTLRGTVQPHNAYILLHAPPDQPPTTFPPKGPISPLHKRLQSYAVKWGGVVNWVWHRPPPPPPSCSDPNPDAACNSIVDIEAIVTRLKLSSTPTPLSTPTMTTPHNEPIELQKTDSGGVGVDDNDDDNDEEYSATVFSKNGRLEIPQVTLSNIDRVEETIRLFAVADDFCYDDDCDRWSSSGSSPGVLGVNGTGSENANELEEIHMLICTHMSRDCRCGVRGGAFARTVRMQIAQREFLLGDGEKRVKLKLGEVAHVGGHHYAPNVLIYPFGDWYGVVSPEQVSGILDDLTAAIDSHGVRALGKTEEPVLTSVKDHWRGRMGMSKQEQAALAQRLGLGQQPEHLDIELVD